MSKLSKVGLLEEVERRYSRISTEGCVYLSGEIDASTLEQSE
ncbi:phage PhiH1 repressor protein [Haloferax larsenii JCM 13917]|nr:phage PhiH1 repressor protein [Haloferax larsenii JCM 13917]